jgi:hypothetical protein
MKFHQKKKTCEDIINVEIILLTSVSLDRDITYGNESISTRFLMNIQ